MPSAAASSRVTADDRSSRPTFYTVADDRFFVGVVALLNSLRIAGNEGELVVLDCGLRRDQRRRLEPHVTLVAAPPEVGTNPYLVKPYPYLLDPVGVVVLIDSDVIVTGSLDAVVDQARTGRICIYPEVDGSVVRNRWNARWSEVFALKSPLRQEPYRAAGFVAFSASRWPSLLPRWWELTLRIPSEGTMQRGAPFDSPFWGADMDALNALLMSEVERDAVLELPFLDAPREWWLRQVRVVDPTSLACSLDGTAPVMLHYLGRPKPWQAKAWMRVRGSAFERLLPRVLLASDVPLRLAPDDLPLWLRPTRLGRSTLDGLALGNSAARELVHRTPTPVRVSVSSLRARLTG
jgi:hypothetical protein